MAVARRIGCCALLLGATLTAACGGGSSPSEVPAPLGTDTELGVGDIFEVRVYGEEDLTGRYSVAEDGSIDFPLIGRLEVRDMKPPEVANLLEEKLVEMGYLRSPHVSILVEEYRSKRISVVGAVSEPGSYPVTPGMTIMQAISSAGGFTALANQNSTTVTRRIEDELTRIRVPAGRIQRGEAPDFRLQPGDIVYVPERVF
ncbi:MAG: polysaccharide biosynthesis/export family protein [Myxococcota bacterium]